MRALFLAVLLRDLRLAARRRIDALLPLVFFVVAISLFPLGLRSGGMLLILIVLPLAMPALIFGAGAVVAVEAGESAAGHYSLLGALLIATALGAPLATAAALRISTE